MTKASKVRAALRALAGVQDAFIDGKIVLHMEGTAAPREETLRNALSEVDVKFESFSEDADYLM